MNRHDVVLMNVNALKKSRQLSAPVLFAFRGIDVVLGLELSVEVLFSVAREVKVFLIFTPDQVMRS